jgi:hypothetical protein
MRRQLGVSSDSSDDDPIVRRNRDNVEKVLALLRGEAVAFPAADPWDCPQAENAAS